MNFKKFLSSADNRASVKDALKMLPHKKHYTQFEVSNALFKQTLQDDIPDSKVIMLKKVAQRPHDKKSYLYFDKKHQHICYYRKGQKDRSMSINDVYNNYMHNPSEQTYNKKITQFLNEAKSCQHPAPKDVIGEAMEIAIRKNQPLKDMIAYCYNRGFNKGFNIGNQGKTL